MNTVEDLRNYVENMDSHDYRVGRFPDVKVARGIYRRWLADWLFDKKAIPIRSESAAQVWANTNGLETSEGVRLLGAHNGLRMPVIIV